MSYRPTALHIADENCARALDHWEAGVPYDRDVFQVGIAAHSIVQACGEETNRRGEILTCKEMQTIARVVCEKLIAEGRSFDGNPEPPMLPRFAWAGRDVAIDWLAPRPLLPGGRYEIGLGVTDHWTLTGYDSGSPWLRTAIDILRLDEDEESGERVLTVTDLKTSWAADAERLNHTQQKIQALLALAHFPDADRLDRQVINLRTGMVYTDTVYLAFPETEEKLAEWRADIEGTCRALGTAPRDANPGARCIGCPYLGVCDDGQDYFENVGSIGEYGSIEEKARAFAVAVAVVGHLRDILKAENDEMPVELEDAVVGYQRQEYRELAEDAYGALLEEWCGEDESPERLRGLLRAMKLTKANAEAALKVLYPDRADIEHREEFLDAHTVVKAKRQFRVTRK